MTLKSAHGLSLLEILVASIIMVLVIAGLVSVFVSGKRFILHNKSRISASEVAKYFVEPLQTQVDESAWTTNCVGGMNAAACTALGGSLTNPSDTITYNASFSVDAGPLANLRRVKTHISWQEPSGS